MFEFRIYYSHVFFFVFLFKLSILYVSKFGNGGKPYGEKTVRAIRYSEVDWCQSNLYVTAQKMKFSIKDLVTFTEEILNRTHHFLFNRLC